MGLLDAAKNVLSGEKWDKKPDKTPDNRIDRIDQCKVIWYQWKNELGTTPEVFGLQPPVSSSMIAAARSYDISNHIESVSFTKTMNEGAGAFSITLANSFDWPRWMRPGQWLCIYLSGDGTLPLPKEPGQGGQNSTGGLVGTVASLATGTLGSIASLSGTGLFKPVPKLPLPSGPSDSSFGPSQSSVWKPKLRCMGVIQRVAIKAATTGDGTQETAFVISGKDFGVVFEETELWFNAANAEGSAFVQAIHAISQQFTRNLTELMTKWYDIFLSPKDALSKTITDAKSFFPVQWVLPDQLVKDLGFNMASAGQGTFGDIEGVREFHATIFENPDPLPLAGLQGHCWERLKSLSQPGFHELFTELSDSGNPKLIFRPVPWARDKEKYPKIGSLMLKYKDLATGEAPPILPVGTNTGKFPSLGALQSAIASAAGGSSLPSDARTSHAVGLTAKEVDSYDIGADYHSRSNFFLVDASQHAFDQQNAFALMALDPSVLWPIRDEADIKRHGFRPKFMHMNTFTLQNSQFFGNNPDVDFMKEVNHIMRDLWADSEDYYSGIMLLAAGRSAVKLGKVIVTDNSFQGIGEMAFYIEGYTDTFSVNQDGTCSWTQALNLTRGMQLSVLDGGSSKDKQSTDPGSFHADKNGEKDEGPLGTIKNGITDPTSLF